MGLTGALGKVFGSANTLASVSSDVIDRLKGFFSLANGSPFCVIGEYEVEIGDIAYIKNTNTILLNKIKDKDLTLELTPQETEKYSKEPFDKNKQSEYLRDKDGRLVPDASGKPKKVLINQNQRFIEGDGSIKLNHGGKYTAEENYSKIQVNNVVIKRVPNSIRSLFFDISDDIEITEGNEVTEKPIFLRGEDITGKFESKKRKGDISIQNINIPNKKSQVFDLDRDDMVGAPSTKWIKNNRNPEEKGEIDEEEYFVRVTPAMTFPNMSSKIKPVTIEIKNAKLYDSSIIGLGLEDAINQLSNLGELGEVVKKLGLQGLMGQYFGYSVEDRLNLLRSFSKNRSILLFSYKKDHYDFMQLDQYKISRIPDEPNTALVSLTLKSMNILPDFTQKTVIDAFKKITKPNNQRTDKIFSNDEPETEKENIEQGLKDDDVIVEDNSVKFKDVQDDDTTLGQVEKVQKESAREKLRINYNNSVAVSNAKFGSEFE